MFYTLITCAFSNQIRFNSKGEFNISCGKSDYNASLQEKLRKFIDKMHEKDIEFMCEDFRKCTFNNDCFVYCDPPYYNSIATYNENGGWSKKDEVDLLNYLDNLNKQGIKFALSNNLKYNNQILKGWIKKYNVYYLNSDYSNCNYQKKDRSKDLEVLITNY
jgi:site-specific DNA-adenine methylase